VPGLQKKVGSRLSIDMRCARPQAGAAAFLQQGLQGLQRLAGPHPCRRPLGPAATPPSRSGHFVMRFPFLKQLIARVHCAYRVPSIWHCVR
jgi:hypothetical protein